MSVAMEVQRNGVAYNAEIAEHWLHEPSFETPGAHDDSDGGDPAHAMAVFCYEDPQTVVGQYLMTLVRAIAKWQTTVHVFARKEFDLDLPGVHVHAVGEAGGDNLLVQVQSFTRRACNAFLRELSDVRNPLLMGLEWSTIPTLSLLHAIKNVGTVLSLHSLERQRSPLAGDVSACIDEFEQTGLREARLVLFHDQATAEMARRCVPACAERIVVTSPQTPIEDFWFAADRGEIKSRYEVGPTDPTLLYVGDLGEGYGPDLLVKAFPAVLAKHPQARCILVGDGDLMWPLRVYSRYLLLDHAVRLVGHMDGQTLRELVYAADVIVVPSREPTPWWPIEAAWAAGRPVVATREAAPTLMRHDLDSVLVGADEKELAAGIDRVLTDQALVSKIAQGGRTKLQERYSVNKVAIQIEELLGLPQACERRPHAATV